MKTHPSPPLALPLLSAGSLLFLLAWQHVQVTRLGYRFSQIQREVESQSQSNSYLKLELQQLSSPERLELIAKSRLGLVLPSYDSMILIDPPLSAKETPKKRFRFWG